MRRKSQNKHDGLLTAPNCDNKVLIISNCFLSFLQHLLNISKIEKVLYKNYAY